MKVTREFLEEKRACAEGMRWVTKNRLIGKAPKTFINALIKGKHEDWANWLIDRLFDHDRQVKYAIYAAEQVIEIFEKKYPEDKRPRKAIEAAKQYLKTHSGKDKNAAYAAASAAYAAKRELKIKIIKYGLTLLEVK
jgi:predicted metal-dependent hydrolase